MAEEEVEQFGGSQTHEVDYYQGSQATCGRDGCNLGRTEAEKAYETLMSGVPDPGVQFTLPSNPNKYVTPTQGTLDMVMNAIRPPDEHAIQPIANLWKSLSDEHLNNIEADLKNSTQTLSNSWVGDDFDGLAENMETTLANLGRTREKIIELYNELNEAAENLRTYQQLGTGGVPFPPAGFNLVGRESGCCDDYKLHIRPPWHSGPCEIKEGGDDIAEVLLSEGASFAQEVRNKIESDAQILVEQGGTVSEPSDQNTTMAGP
jgi:uncharacterized protein YukE